ncbi:hypothetical protein [Fluviicola sp.]|uniref:hypothetical protein n=1 Tax=Fluviicola sp. TaxID=1917219 RepID=UPI003D265BCD
MSATKIIIILSHIPVFAVALYALFIYKSLKPELKWFSGFLFSSGVLQLVSFILWFLKINNLFVLHLLVPVGFFFIALYYRSILKDFLDKSILLITACCFAVFSLLNSLFYQSIQVFNSSALTVECVLILILSLSTYILFLNKELGKKKLHSASSLNWINSGLFIYHASTLLIFYFGEYITSNINLELSRYTWVVHSFFSVIMYFCFWRGLWNRIIK